MVFKGHENSLGGNTPNVVGLCHTRFVSELGGKRVKDEAVFKEGECSDKEGECSNGSAGLLQRERALRQF